jgi:uncharacterized membrane protein YgdD (TMEM256/DUF423 family)
MKQSTAIRVAASVIFLGITLGAFGAHLLDGKLEETGRLDTWETATLYHLIHGFALFVIAISGKKMLGFAGSLLESSFFPAASIPLLSAT